MKKLLNKRGMTYVELLVAFTLLMLIVVSFTPMLLKSYEAVYSAGEKSANLYSARTKLEDGLATRRSADTESITLNFTDYISETRIVGRRVPATTEAMLETLFYGAHSTIEIISPKHVPDDSSTYQVILQATNIPVTFDSVNGKTKDDVAAAEASKTKDDNNVVALIAKAPVKTTGAGADTTTEDAAYDTNGYALDLTVNSVDAANGKITITLKAPAGKSLDFTTSPIRIQAYYINERGIMKSVCDYLYIDPMTILIGGKSKSNTSAADYFTTAGVTKSLANTTASFSVEGRTMPLDNVEKNKYVESPKGKTSFTTITWIDNDMENELAPYYVMTGTDGYIYRMYNFTHNGDLYKKTASQTNTGSLKTTKDGFMSLKSGAVAYPSYWSGDYTDWYSFQTAKDANTYGLDYGKNRNDGGDNNFDCSFLTIYNSIDGTANNDAYSNRAHYSMVFSGYKTNYKYLSARGRRISYVLAEHGTRTFRLAGKLDKDSDYKGFNSRWENDTYAYQGEGDKTEGGFLGIAAKPYTDQAKAVYFKTKSGLSWSNNDVYDCNYAAVYLKSFTSIPPTALESVKGEFRGAFWCPFSSDSDANDDGNVRYSDSTGQNNSEDTVRNSIRSTGTMSASGDPQDEWGKIGDWVNSKYATNVNLTSVSYIPVSTGEGKGDGQLVYFGTVPSYGLIMQHDAKNNTNSDYDTPNKVWNNDQNGDLPSTAYYVDGNAETGTNIYRFSGTAGVGADEHTPVPARYARWITAKYATKWKPEQYATWVNARFDTATPQYAEWIHTQWNTPGGPRLVKVQCRAESYWGSLYCHLYPYNSNGTVNYNTDLAKDSRYCQNGDWKDGSFWYLYYSADDETNPNSNYHDFLNYIDRHEKIGTTIDQHTIDTISYKHECDESWSRDDFPEGARVKNGTVTLWVVEIGTDHISDTNKSRWSHDNLRDDQPGNVPGRPDLHNMIAGTGPGFWDHPDQVENTTTGLLKNTNCWVNTSGQKTTVRSAADLAQYYTTSEQVTVQSTPIYTGGTPTSGGTPHAASGSTVNARNVSNMIAGTGKGPNNWRDENGNPLSDDMFSDVNTGLYKDTNCWGDNGAAVTVRDDVAAENGGTDHQGGKPGDPDALNMIAKTGPGYYYDGSGNVTTDQWGATGDGGNPWKDSSSVQNQIKNSIGTRAAPDPSHNTNDKFYNTFRDTKTYLYNDKNLEFTFGYCSNWLIGAGTVVIQTKAELTSGRTDSYSVAKSFEKFYVRSNPSASQGNSTAANNLFYDTWFPGEYYNLTQTASLDGVTVACGYAVAGSAFEARPDPFKDQNGTGDYRYSTALGGIYNDGVLSIYDDTKRIETGTGNYVNGGFRNILYYKSPTFDNATTHNRQSVRFTAVDLMSELVDDAAGEGKKHLDYYAWYGDNHGNVYRSKVASTSAINDAGTGQLNLTTNLTYDNTDGGMRSVVAGGSDAFTNGHAMSTLFSEIEKITCAPNMVIITGKAYGNDAGNVAKAAIVYREQTVDKTPGSETYGQVTYGDWKTKVVSLGPGHINDAIVLGDYYYAVGATSATSSVGKIWAVKISALVNNGSDSADTLPNLVTLTTSSNGSPLPELTCIGGRITGVNRADNDA